MQADIGRVRRHPRVGDGLTVKASGGDVGSGSEGAGGGQSEGTHDGREDRVDC